jgi:hypothetical protein
MKAPFLARRTHKWLALVVGIQAVFWMVSGAYMAAVNIDFIHGDSLVRNLAVPVNGESMDFYPIADVIERYPEAVRVDVVSRLGQPHYQVTTGSVPVLLDARNGNVKSPVDHDRAVALATYYYAGGGEVSEVRLLADANERPTEIQTRSLPLWQVRFDDAIDTTFYVSPATGELVTRRHTFWRLYDFLWMFHIMDYENRTDINNNLLRLAALLGFGFTLSGAWLLVYAMKRRDTRLDGRDTGETGSSRTNDLVPKTP